MVTVNEQFTSITPSRTRYTTHNRLQGYFTELREKRKTATPRGPNRINNFDSDEPFGKGNNNKDKINYDLSNIGIAFLASTFLTIGVSKLNALEVFGEKIAGFIKTALSGLSISLGAIALSKFLTKSC